MEALIKSGAAVLQATMTDFKTSSNVDARTVAGFGEEWQRFDQSPLPYRELERTFLQYFSLFPWHALRRDAVGFDLGCGSGRWARFVADRVGQLYCIDASEAALEVAQRNLSSKTNCQFHCASVDSIPLPDDSVDFGYSLGVLHHVPDTFAGIRCCVAKLKSGAPFLLYLYYAFDNRPVWYRALWKATDLLRRFIARLPHRARYLMTQVIAACVYFPLARAALMLERAGLDVQAFPLAAYRNISFYSMRCDALDRFGTHLEQRFTQSQIRTMMQSAGLERISFSGTPPYWCALGYKTPLSSSQA